MGVLEDFVGAPRRRGLTPEQVVAELVDASRAMLADETESAKGSYREWNGHQWMWNDEVWFSADREGFKLALRVRRALEAYDALARPPRRAKRATSKRNSTSKRRVDERRARR